MRLLGGAVAGIHSMIDEHFGICVVEYMAAGAIPIGVHIELICLISLHYYAFYLALVLLIYCSTLLSAHNSAGPKMDIVLEEDGEQTGFLAQTVEEYADAILQIIRLPETKRLKMADAARRRAAKFSEQRFFKDFKDAVRPVFSHGSRR